MPKSDAKSYWCADVTKHSDALDLEGGVFTWKDPKRIATSLQQSAERSSRRKGSPRQSPVSMLTFSSNQAGTNLGAAQRTTLERAKEELRVLFSGQ